MALEDKLKQAPPQEDPANEEELDLKIAVLLGERLLEEGGYGVIEKAVKSSSDAGQVIGQFLMQMGQQLHEGMPDDAKLSPTIMLAQGGWIEQMSDLIQEEGAADKATMNKAEVYVASTAQQMADAKGGQANGVPLPPGGGLEQGMAPPAAPQPGMM